MGSVWLLGLLSGLVESTVALSEGPCRKSPAGEAVVTSSLYTNAHTLSNRSVAHVRVYVCTCVRVYVCASGRSDSEITTFEPALVSWHHSWG